MTAITAYPLVRANTQQREHASVHAVEKVSPRAGFNGEYSPREEPKSWVCTPHRAPKSSQSETEHTDPFWNGPRLTPQFVAHVMGQVYCSNTPNAAASNAYRRSAALRPLILDKNV